MCDQSLSQTKFPKHINDRFHRGLIGNGDWSHIQYFLQFEGWWSQSLGRISAGKQHQ